MFSQNCNDQMTTDSLYKPAEKQSVLVNVLKCPLKNGGNIEFINNKGKLILKITPNQKLGFVDVGSLQIKSAGNKSIFFKNITYYNHKDPGAYFLVDVLINYIATLRDDGLTSLVFNEKFEADFKDDQKNIRKTAKCFYELNKK
jgi:hypothetical protein